MSDSDWGWLSAGAAGGASLVLAFTSLIKSLKADPNKSLDTDLEQRRLDLAEDRQESEQAERAVEALMALLKETHEMLREERAGRKEWQEAAADWQHAAEALQRSNDELREEVACLRNEVHGLREQVADKTNLRREIEETRQILEIYRAKDKE